MWPAACRADEADSLARVYQQQLLSRQQAVTAWQDALVEMEERYAPRAGTAFRGGGLAGLLFFLFQPLGFFLRLFSCHSHPLSCTHLVAIHAPPVSSLPFPQAPLGSSFGRFLLHSLEAPSLWRRETSAQEQLQELQTRCREQAQRAQQAEHVAATAQLRLERLMAAQAEVPGAATGGESPPPPPQVVYWLRAPC